MSREIRAAVQVLIDLHIASWDRVASLASLQVSKEFNKVSLDPRATYEEVFLAGLKSRYFSVCFNDFSFLQISLNGNGRRLAFYPNPFLFDDELVELIEDPTDFDAYELEELKATASRSPIRLDVDPEAHSPCWHPYSHLHIGHGELGRLACRRVLSPKSFALLVARSFYPEEWRSRDGYGPDQAGFTNEADAWLSASLQNDLLLEAPNFTEVERRLFHLI